MYAGARSSAPVGQDVESPSQTEAAGFYNSPSATPTRWTVKQRDFPLSNNLESVVMPHSVSTFFEHTFVFVGLCFLAQIPGAAVGTLLRNLGMGGMIVSTVISFVFALIAQGAISYGVYESRKGNAAEFGESLVSGMTRSGPLLLGGAALIGSFILEVAFGAMMLDSNILFLVGSLAGIFLVALPTFLLIISLGAAGLLWEQFMSFFPALEPPFELSLVVLIVVAVVLVYKSPCIRWAVFVPACVVEELGPIESLKRSSELVDGLGASPDILNFSLKYCFGTFLFIPLGGIAVSLITLMTGSFSRGDPMAMFFTMEPNSILEAVLKMLIIAIPMAYGYVMIAVTYYELRNAREEVTYY